MNLYSDEVEQAMQLDQVDRYLPEKIGNRYRTLHFFTTIDHKENRAG